MDSTLDRMIANDLLPDRALLGRCAVEWAGYKRALARVERLDPGLVGGPGVSPLSELDEATVALVNAAWRAGARVGAAIARVDDAFDAPYLVCHRCQGYGHQRGRATAEESCIGCDGIGIVTRDGEWVGD